MKYTIVIPTYNSSKYLKECLDSVFAQDLSNSEIIIIDDASKDNTLDIINYYINGRNNIKFFKNQTNHGPSYCRNIGIKYSKGDYIIFVDSDDILDKNFIKNCDKCILNNHNTDFILFPDTRNRDELGKETREILYCKNQLLGHYNRTASDIEVEMDGPWAKVFKKSIITNNNLLFNEDIRIGEDILFNFEYSLNVNNNVLKGSTISYLFRDDEYTINGKPYIDIDNEIIKFINEYIELIKKYHLESTYYDKLYFNIINGYSFIYFIRNLFNKSFNYTKKEQKTRLKVFFNRKIINTALHKTKIKSYSSKKKQLLIVLLRLHLFSIGVYVLRKRYYK